MAGSVNKVMLIGNLGADPDVKALQNGSKVANFSLATSESWKDKATGEKKEKTEWHRVVVWNERLIGIIEKYMQKGDKVYVEGQLQTRKWEKDGIDHYSTEVVLSGFNGSITMLSNSRGGGGAADGGGESSDHGGGGSDRAPRRSAGGGRNADMDDDIPF